MAGRLITSWRPELVDAGPVHVAATLPAVTAPARRVDDGPVDLARAALIEREVFAPLPIGIDASGAPVHVNMPGDNGRHVLVIGASGAGKTTCMHAMLLGMAPRRHVAIVVVDPKELDFAMWSRRAAMMALGEGGAVTAFGLVVAELGARKRRLRDYNLLAVERGWESLTRLPVGVPVLGTSHEYIVLAVDELETLTDTKADPAANQRRAHLRRLLRLGRALGIGVLSASQRPSYDVVPLGIRDLHRTRIVFGTESRQQSEVGWGEGYAELEPYPPHQIRQIGEAFMRVDRAAKHLQAYLPSPQQITAGAAEHPRVPGPAHWPLLIEDDEQDACPLCGHDITEDDGRRRARR